MSQKDKEQIIRDYLSGKYSEEGEALFNAWYQSEESNTSPMDGLSSSEKEKIRLEMLNKVKQDLHQPVKHFISEETKRSRIFQNRIYRYAAVWIGLLLLGFGYFTFNSYYIELVKVQTAYGELKTVTLPDGSTVTLNAKSSLEYAETWSDKEDRQVWLDGEAYFSVVHTDHDQRFQVKTPAMEIEVLGTEFNVNNRQQNTEVVLVSGKVKLEIKYPEQEKELYMAPGDLVAYSAVDTKIYQKTVNPDQYSAWRNHDLLVDNISLAEIAQALESFYGFDIIIIDDSLKQKKLSATAKLSLEDTTVLFTAISEIYDIEIKQAENKIIFSSP